MFTALQPILFFDSVRDLCQAGHVTVTVTRDRTVASKLNPMVWAVVGSEYVISHYVLIRIVDPVKVPATEPGTVEDL
jgi:hypothetical protein